MALVHDLAEALCGDITPTQKIPKIEKHEIEKRALDEMLVVLEGSLASQEIMDLWKEYEEEESEIALFVKDVDKFEMILQAFEYEKRKLNTSINTLISNIYFLGELKRMDTFFDSTRCKFKHGFIIGLVEALNKRRNAYFESINGQ